MARASSNRDIAKSGNRKPRVHIEYKTYTGGAMKLVSLPFVMGVMADLSGRNRPDKLLKDRRFVDFDAKSLDSKMKEMRPRASFSVDNKLDGQGGVLNVDLTFESMKDFTPEGIARKIEPLRVLLQQRERLQALETNLDGKDTRELESLLNNPQVLKALSEFKGGAKEGN
ncbi:MAG: type VI secretion system contractile sheath small subunit [Planctomycetota bacterium]|nr:type VI secretion system contractile sheath small subunit [Planctomycetota bacterium]